MATVSTLSETVYVLAYRMKHQGIRTIAYASQDSALKEFMSYKRNASVTEATLAVHKDGALVGAVVNSFDKGQS